MIVALPGLFSYLILPTMHILLCSYVEILNLPFDLQSLQYFDTRAFSGIKNAKTMSFYGIFPILFQL